MALGILLALLWAGMTVLYGVGLVSAVSGSDADVDALAVLPQLIGGLLVLGFAPMLGLMELQRPVGEITRDAAPARPVRLFVYVAVTALAAVVYAVGAGLDDVPAPLIAGFLLGAVGAGATSLILGRSALIAAHARRAEAAGSDAAITPDLDWTPADIRRKLRTIVVVFVGTLVVSSVVAVLFTRGRQDGHGDAFAAVIQLSFLAAVATCIVVSRQALLGAAPIIADLTAAEKKAVGRRAFGAGDPLEPELEWRAARYAATTRVSQPFLAAQTGLLLVGVLVPLVIRAGSESWVLVGAGALVLLVVVTVPFVVRQQRRLRRHAESTRDLARSFGPGTASAPEPDPTA